MRYRSVLADSARWEGFAFRPGDIVISTPPKCGTTWTQMLCALLIFDGPAFPASMDETSPWLDMCNRSLGEQAFRAMAAAGDDREEMFASYAQARTRSEHLTPRPQTSSPCLG